MQRRFRQICTSLKEHRIVSYAKFASAGGLCDINLVIIKATSPDDIPVHEKYIYQLLKIFSISPASYHSFVLCFTRRFGTTHSWRVALKCLVLLHRLLRSVPRDSPFLAEMLWSRSNGLISLYPCRFRDDSSSCAFDYTLFIRFYAQLLDEALNCVFLGSKKVEVLEEKEEKAQPKSFQEKMQEIGEILEILPQLQSLVDRVIDCRPTFLASQNIIVRSSMKYIIRDSFVCYTKFRTEMVVVLDNLFHMPYRNCAAAFEIYKKASLQTTQLCEFYDWSKAKGLCGFYEYPTVDRIPSIQIQALETLFNGMWQLTESSSSLESTSPSSWTAESPQTTPPSLSAESSQLIDEVEGEKSLQLVRRDVVGIKKDFKFDKVEDKPLIDREDGEEDDVSWEKLLDSSINFSDAYSSDLCFASPNGYGWEAWRNGFDISRFNGNNIEGHEFEDHSRQIQIYKPIAANPFSQLNDFLSNNYGRIYGHNSSY